MKMIIVLGWLLIIAFKCLRLLTGLQRIHTLKQKQVFEAGEYWNARLNELAKKISVKQPVRLLRSVVAKIPMVAGHFKPVILIPAGMLTTLPEKEIEAILLHELAHIRRKDYLVNLLQSFAEIIFFFNPAVLWLSSLIRDERENCCDDIAIGEVKNKKEFIQALLSFHENNALSTYAPSFPGRKNHLVNRVRRIITNNNKTLSNMEKIFLASGILVTCLILAAFSQGNQPVAPKQESTVPLVKNEIPITRTDTVPSAAKNVNNESKSTIKTSIDGKQYTIVEQNGKVTELYVDNVRIPDDKIAQYQPTIDKIHADQKKQLDQLMQEQKALTAQAKVMKEKEFLMKQELEKQAQQMKVEQKELMEQADLMKQKQQEMNQEMEKQVQQMKQQHQELMKGMDTMTDKQKMIMKQEMEKQAEVMQARQKELMGQSEMMQEKQLMMKKQMEQQSEAMKIKSEELMKQMEQMKEQQKIMEKKMLDSIPKSKPQGKGTRSPAEIKSIINDIVQELQSANLAHDPDDLSFSLSNDQLVVNGVQQPGEIFQDLKSRYIKSPGDHLTYNTVKKGSRVDVLVQPSLSKD
jgi:beta-lactamase regulating signal transducer with metallopeptidase domain